MVAAHEREDHSQLSLNTHVQPVHPFVVLEEIRLRDGFQDDDVQKDGFVDLALAVGVRQREGVLQQLHTHPFELTQLIPLRPANRLHFLGLLVVLPLRKPLTGSRSYSLPVLQWVYGSIQLKSLRQADEVRLFWHRFGFVYVNQRLHFALEGPLPWFAAVLKKE